MIVTFCISFNICIYGLICNYCMLCAMYFIGSFINNVNKPSSHDSSAPIISRSLARVIFRFSRNLDVCSISSSAANR